LSFLPRCATSSLNDLPHQFCYLNNKQLIALHIGTDAVIWLSYVAISFSLVYSLTFIGIRKARLSEVSLRILDNQALLSVKDRGRGFASDDRHTTSVGVGIASMRERIRELSGELRVDSGSGGTTVEASIPLQVVAAIYFAFAERFFSVAFTALLPGGSPVAAVSTSPPLSAAICASNFPLIADFGFANVMSSLEAYSSLCLISSHDVFPLPPKPRVRTNTQEP
jgi:hypothetical protein